MSSTGQIAVGTRVRYRGNDRRIGGEVCEIIDNQPGDGFDYILLHRNPGGVNYERKIVFTLGDFDPV